MLKRMMSDIVCLIIRPGDEPHFSVTPAPHADKIRPVVFVENAIGEVLYHVDCTLWLERDGLHLAFDGRAPGHLAHVCVINRIVVVVDKGTITALGEETRVDTKLNGRACQLYGKPNQNLCLLELQKCWTTHPERMTHLVHETKPKLNHTHINTMSKKK